MACHISGVYDVNRNTILEGDNFELVRDWAESLAAAAINGIIFHNNFTKETCKKYENDYISFVKIDYNPTFNPNVFRYFVYNSFLQQHIKDIKNLFITDITDVVLVRNPFIDDFFVKNPTSVFCGDEPKKLENDWMIAHSEHLRKKIADYADYENKFRNETLLNCGIAGGAAPLLFNFIHELCTIHQQYNAENNTAFTGDMGAFNYLARTKYNTQLKHGAPVNTVFKLYESERTDCWFRHK